MILPNLTMNIQKMCSTFEIKDLGNFDELLVQSDILLFIHIFEIFR